VHTNNKTLFVNYFRLGSRGSDHACDEHGLIYGLMVPSHSLTDVINDTGPCLTDVFIRSMDYIEQQYSFILLNTQLTKTGMSTGAETDAIIWI